MDEPSPSLHRYQAECRRVGVVEAELLQIIRHRRDAYLKEHPHVRERLERDHPDIDLEGDDIAHMMSPEIALEVLAKLPDGAGTRAFLDRLEAVERARGWSPL